MQIDRYNHLSFPRDASTGNNPAAGGKDAALSLAAAAAPQAKPQADSAAPAVVRAAGRPEGVVLKIQRPVGDALNNPDPGVYSNGRRAVVPDPVDNGAMARGHQLAVDRNAGIVTQISVDKDGVLIARPHPLAPDKQPDFVALAVSAMREYSDEHDRQKMRAMPDATAAPAQTPWSAIKGLQQIAAKLNVFA